MGQCCGRGATDGGNLSEFQEDCLKRHNELRKKHNTAPVQLNRKLCAFSQKWAMNLANKNKFEHRKNRNFQGNTAGENIAMKESTAGDIDYTGAEVADYWYSEISKYQFGGTGPIPGTGHFTQVVWKGTTEVGFGKAKKGNRVVAVGNYMPAGNMVGDFDKNVLPL